MGAFDDLVPRQSPQTQGGATTVQNPDGTTTVVTHNADGSWDVGQPQKQSAAPVSAPQAPYRPTAFDDLIMGGSGSARPDAFKPPSALNALAGMAGARSFAEGVPMLGQAANYADAATNATLAPAIEPLLDMIPGHNKANDVGGGDWQARYSKALMMQRAMDAAAQQAHPLITLGDKIAGGVTGAVAGARVLSPASSLLAKLAPEAGLVPTMGANAADAGLVGSGMGYLNGTGGFGDPSRVQGAKQGAEFGALTGAALAPASSVAKSVWNATGSKLVDALMGHINVGGAAPETVGASSGFAPNPADSMPGAPTYSPTPPPSPPVTAPRSAVNGAYDRVFQALARGGATPEQAFSQVGKLGPQGMLADTNVPAQDFARTVADAPGQGGQIAADALNVRQEGLRQNGQYSAPSSGQRIGDTLAQALQVQGPPLDDQVAALVKQQQTQAAPLYAKAYTAEPVPVSAFQDFSSSPRFQEAYGAARKISQSEFVPQADGSMKLQPLPPEMPKQLDWRTLDLMKQAMDDQYRVSKSPLSGIAANGQRAVLSYNKQFLSTLDGLNPDYAPARAAFSGPANAMDAAEAGRAYVGENPATARTSMADLDPGDRQMFQVGAVQGMKDKLGTNTTANAARAAGLYSPNMVPGKMQPLFGDNQAGYANYANTLENENAMFGTRARVMGGSQTSRNLAQEQDAGLDPLDLARQVAEFHVDPTSGVLNLMSKLLTAGNGQSMSEPVANSAAKILFDQNNGAYPEYMSGLGAAAKRAALAKLLAGSRGTIGGYAGNIDSKNNQPPSGP